MKDIKLCVDTSNSYLWSKSTRWPYCLSHLCKPQSIFLVVQMPNWAKTDFLLQPTLQVKPSGCLSNLIIKHLVPKQLLPPAKHSPYQESYNWSTFFPSCSANSIFTEQPKWASRHLAYWISPLFNILWSFPSHSKYKKINKKQRTKNSPQGLGTHWVPPQLQVFSQTSLPK